MKAVGPEHVTTSHAPNPSPLLRTLADAYDPTDDFLMKDSVDFFGTSFYPKFTAPEHNFRPATSIPCGAVKRDSFDTTITTAVSR